MKLIIVLATFLVIFQVFSGVSGCEKHRRMMEAARRRAAAARAARERKLQEQAIEETKAQLEAEGYVRAGEKTAVIVKDTPDQPRKSPTKVQVKLQGLGNNQGAYVRNYNHGLAQGQRCPGTNFVCPIGRQCVYQRGWKCELPKSQTCPAGFEKIEITPTKFRCEDINECEDEELNDCDHVCKNLWGSYRCECPPGFHFVDGKCEDVDECSQVYPMCQHECVNLPGSYECTCPEGYELVSGTRCSDINECATNPCEEGTCMNLYGSYQCNLPEQCEEGYSRNKRSSFGPCIINNYTLAYNYENPFSIMTSKFSIHSGYKAGTQVARLSFPRSKNHRYNFNIVEGGEFFTKTLVPRQYKNTLVITTIRDMVGPAVHHVTIEIQDRDLNPKRGVTNVGWLSRMDLTFVVSEFDF